MKWRFCLFLFLALMQSCVDENKGTLGAPSAFSTQGEGLNLRSNVKRAENGISSLFQTFPFQQQNQEGLFRHLSKHSQLFIQIQQTLQKAQNQKYDQGPLQTFLNSENIIQEIHGDHFLIKEVGVHRSIQIRQHLTQQLVSFEYLETFPHFILLRMYQLPNAHVHVLYSFHPSAKDRLVNFMNLATQNRFHSILIYSPESPQAFVFDYFNSIGERINTCFKVPPTPAGQPIFTALPTSPECTKFERYVYQENHQIPEIIQHFDQLENIDPEYQYKVKSLQEFYESF